MGRSSSRSCAQKQVYSLEVKALDRAPTASKAWAMSWAVRRSDPLKSRCSRKWEQPASATVSSRLPVSTQHPTATERTDGMVSLMTRRPLGRVVRRCSMGA